MVGRVMACAFVAAALAAQSGTPTKAGPTVALEVDAAASRVVIDVGKAGVLGFAGHAHEVIASSMRGQVRLDPADWSRTSVWIELDTTAFRVTGRGEPAADVPEVQRVMLGDRVLDVAKYPRILFRSSRVSVAAATSPVKSVAIEGDLSLRGSTRPLSVQASVRVGADGRLTAEGAFRLRQSDFGMVPVTAAGGAVRVRDELDIRFVIVAAPGREAS